MKYLMPLFAIRIRRILKVKILIRRMQILTRFVTSLLHTRSHEVQWLHLHPPQGGEIFLGVIHRKNL